MLQGLNWVHFVTVLAALLPTNIVTMFCTDMPI
jgi:hypothetical protein